MITLRGVTKRYGSAVALHPTDFAVARGETVALLGTSGAGKSTLLRCVLRLVVPDEGTVAVDGEPVTSETAEALRRRVGYVIQSGGLFPHLTARANVALLARHLGWNATRVEGRISELARLTRLSIDLFDRFPQQLSGGQRQRVALARALFLDPDVLLLDEPLGALDPITRDELQRDLQPLLADKTALFVTHDLHEAAILAHRVAVMEGGRVVQQGSMADLVDRPATPFVGRFVAAQAHAL